MGSVEVCNEDAPWLERQSVFYCASLSNQNNIELGSMRSIPNPLLVNILSSMSLLKLKANTVFGRSCKHQREQNSGFSLQVGETR